MNDFTGLLPSDFGIKSESKSVSMAPPRSVSARTSGSPLNFDLPSHTPSTSSWSSTPISGSFEQSSLFNNSKSQDAGDAFDNILGGSSGGPAKRTNKTSDDVFNFDWSGSGEKSSAPVYDKPVYDEDIFDGIPGLKSSSSVKYENVFSSIAPPSKEGDAFDDLLGGLGRTKPELNMNNSGRQGLGKGKKGVSGFEDLIPGFGGESSHVRSKSEADWHSNPVVHESKATPNMMEDPFVVLESASSPKASSSGKFADPLEHKPINSANMKVNNKSGSNGAFDDIDPLDGLGKSVPRFTSEMNSRGKDHSPSKSGPSASGAQHSFGRDPIQKASVSSHDKQFQKTASDNPFESGQNLYDMPKSAPPSVSKDFHKSAVPSVSPLYGNLNPNEAKIERELSPQTEESIESSDDLWLTVDEIPLFTQPTSAPPPSRPPPPRPVHISKKDTKVKVNEFSTFSSSSQHFQNSRPAPNTEKSSVAFQIDELQDFAMGRAQNNDDEDRDAVAGEDVEANFAAAAMKEAMDRAEAKFRHAKELRERENVKTARFKEAAHLERDETAGPEAQEKAFREKQERTERELHQREREEEEREQKRLERERERARETEKERERARQAVERATREARERAATEARIKAERAAVDKANAEARARAERAAVQRAQAEARERAAADAKERAERAAAEAREKANAREKEAREKADVARGESEARRRAERTAVERAAAEARERAAFASKANQQKNENDLESFFNMGARPSSAPRPRANSSESAFDTQFQDRQGPETVSRTSSGVPSNMRKASSTANFVDDLTSIFGAAPSSGQFQEVEGESEERRRSRLDRHQRTQERAAKALAEKNERDLQTQRDQAERHRIAETLDIEIKRWAAGKEGNLRALLSTLQYVLWPECGWQPVSLTDLITAASVKKVYRKSTLCIHPDKVQQKGANLQQKYIAEKVFDLLKEAWNKFNSEELF